MKHAVRAASLAILFAATLLTGCSEKEDPNLVRFRYWGDTEEIRIITGLLKDFEKANPGIKVRPERKPAGPQYMDTLMTELAGGKAPDVYFLGDGDVARFSTSSMTRDLKPFLDNDSEIRAEDFYPSILGQFMYDGKLVGLPRDIAPITVIYYNKALFDKAGLAYPKDTWTRAQFLETAKKLTIRDSKGNTKQWGFTEDWGIEEAWVYAAGGRYMDDFTHPKRLMFGEPETADAIQFRYDLVRTWKVQPAGSDLKTISGGGMAMFLNQNTAMFHSGIWKTPEFRKIKNFDWDIVAFPFKKGAKNAMWLGGGSGYCMNGRTKKPELAWKVIRFMAGPEGQRRMAKTGLAQPALKTLAESKAFLDGQKPHNKKIMLKMAEHSLMAPRWEPWIELKTSLYQPQIDKIFAPGFEGNIEKILAELAAKAQERYLSNFEGSI